MLTLELKILKMFREHIDAESFKYTVLLIRLKVRKPTAGVEITSISGSWINRRQWCRWTIDPFQTIPSMYSSISFSGSWEAQSFADFKSFCMFNTGSPIWYLYLRDDFLAAIYSQLNSSVHTIGVINQLRRPSCCWSVCLHFWLLDVSGFLLSIYLPPWWSGQVYLAEAGRSGVLEHTASLLPVNKDRLPAIGLQICFPLQWGRQ